MSTIPLRLGVFGGPKHTVRRSGIRFLRQDGHYCRPGEVFAYCNVNIEPNGAAGTRAKPLAGELELQMALAPSRAGRLKIATGNSLGGYHDFLGVFTWDAATVIAGIEPLDGGDAAATDDCELRHMMLAGRRATDLADVHSGLLPGWHNRCRAWWGDAPEDMLTLLSLGICDAAGAIRGDDFAFLELFEAAKDPTHVVYVDYPVTPCARIILEQFQRRNEDLEAIRSDIQAGLFNGLSQPAPADFHFAGALLHALESSPLAEHCNVVAASATGPAPAPKAVLLSLNAEPQRLLRHKQLGYTLHLFWHRSAAAGAAMTSWLKSRFEIVERSIDDIGADYAALFDTVSRQTGAHFLVLNRMSSSGQEDISSYAPFDRPLSASLANIESKELNIALHQVAAGRAASVIDVDAIAAEMGGAAHIPDGMHQSGAMQSAVRTEILAALQPLRCQLH